MICYCNPPPAIYRPNHLDLDLRFAEIDPLVNAHPTFIHPFSFFYTQRVSLVAGLCSYGLPESS